MCALYIPLLCVFLSFFLHSKLKRFCYNIRLETPKPATTTVPTTTTTTTTTTTVEPEPEVITEKLPQDQPVPEETTTTTTTTTTTVSIPPIDVLYNAPAAPSPPKDDYEGQIPGEYEIGLRSGADQ